MKKLGFTLTEIIIALGIVGVVAAISTPLLNNLVPDKDKIAVLKAYKIITDVNNEILETTQWMVNRPNNWPAERRQNCVGLQCLFPPDRIIEENGNIRNATNDERSFPYEELFARNLDLRNGIQHPGNVGTVLETTDGIRWFINSQNWNNDIMYLITIDVMDERRPHRVFNRNNTPKPGQFSFAVNSRGTVSANDPLTNAFLSNPNKLNDRNADRRTAKNDNKAYRAVRTY